MQRFSVGPPEAACALMRSIHNDDYRLLLDLLRQVREAAGITQIDLAERLMNTQSYVSKCERGERRIDVMELVSYCDAMGIDPARLMASYIYCRHNGRNVAAEVGKILRRRRTRSKRSCE